MKTSKTKDRIRDGLYAAMKTKAYADITITDVIKASGIARASFYRSYKNLDDVLRDIIAKYRIGLERLFFPELLFSGKEPAINRIADFLQRIKIGDIPLTDLLHENLAMLIYRMGFGDIPVHSESISETERRYVFPVTMGILFTVALNWAKSGYPETPYQLACYVHTLIPHA